MSTTSEVVWIPHRRGIAHDFGLDARLGAYVDVRRLDVRRGAGVQVKDDRLVPGRALDEVPARVRDA